MQALNLTEHLKKMQIAFNQRDWELIAKLDVDLKDNLTRQSTQSLANQVSLADLKQVIDEYKRFSKECEVVKQQLGDEISKLKSSHKAFKAYSDAQKSFLKTSIH